MSADLSVIAPAERVRRRQLGQVSHIPCMLWLLAPIGMNGSDTSDTPTNQAAHTCDGEPLPSRQRPEARIDVIVGISRLFAFCRLAISCP